MSREAKAAIDAGASILILSDRDVGPDWIPIPSLLATAAPAAGATVTTAPSVAAAAMGVVATGMGAMAMPIAAGQELRPPAAVEVAFDSRSQAGPASELGSPVTVAPLDGVSIDDVFAGGVAHPASADDESAEAPDAARLPLLQALQK